MSRVAVIVLGNRNSGKSSTWNALFGRTVRTSSEVRELTLPAGLTLPVFLVSGSAEERNLDLADIIDEAKPRVVLCSVQYAEGGRESVRYFLDRGFDLYVQWLNPGYSDPFVLPDTLGFLPFLLHSGAAVSIRDGSCDPARRVRDIADFLTGWASSRRIGT